MKRTRIKKRRIRVILDIWPHWSFQPLEPFFNNERRIVGGFRMEYPPLSFLKRGKTRGGLLAKLRLMKGPFYRCACPACIRLEGDGPRLFKADPFADIR